jgi:heterodisulfide reductase subunit B
LKYYSYFPGCSAESTGRGLGLSTEAIAKPLDIELVEIEDWNCCGSTPYGSLDEEESIVVAARNLALAEKMGFDVVTPCSSCYVTLSKANRHLHDHPALLKKVNEALAVAGLQYNGSLRVRHLVDVLVNDITPDSIAARLKKPLAGLKVAPYYGCQLVRPDVGLDDTEQPVTLDRLVACTGAEPVDFPLKARCCGGSLMLSEEASTLGLVNKLLKSAAENCAQCVVTACPLCQTNLDAYQSRVNSVFKTNFKIPVLFITQLIGLALGLDEKSLGLDANIVAPSNVILRERSDRENPGPKIKPEAKIPPVPTPVNIEGSVRRGSI